MAPSQTHATPAAFPVAMDIMDRAEAMARDCFQKQGMETEAQLVAAVVNEDPVGVAAAEPPAPALTQQTSTKASSSAFHLDEFVLVLPILIFLAGFTTIYLSRIIKDTAASSTRSSPPAVSAQWTGIRTVRGMAGRLTTDEARSALTGSALDTNTEWLTPEALAITRRLGQVSVIDRVGRPEVHWSGLSQETCTAIVKDIYASPSESGVLATVDGKFVGVSCDGPSHEVVLSPHL